MVKLVSLSELQVEKTSSYLIDLSKLLFGATVVPIFVPGNTFNIWFFIAGAGISIFFFGFGLSLTKQKI
jgi:hypothetical protein